MSLLVRPKESLLVGLGPQFNPTFSAAQLIGSDNARPSSGNPVELTGGKNSEFRVTMNRSGYAGTGSNYYQRSDEEKSTTVFFNRIGLGSFAIQAGAMFKLKTFGVKPTSAHQILSTFSATFGIELTALDVDNNLINWTGDNGTVTLQAKPFSLGFVGSTSISISHTTFMQGNILAGTQVPLAENYARTQPHAGGVIGRKFYSVYNDVGIFDTDTLTWSAGGAKTFTDPVGTGDGVRYLYVHQNNGELWRYDTVGGTWSQLATNTLNGGGRGYGTMEYIDGKLYLYGGYRGPSHLTLMTCYDITTDTWSAKTPSTLGRAYCTSCVIDGKMYVVGGALTGELDVSNTLQRYDPVTNSWSLLANVPASLGGGACCNYGNRLYLFGGYNTGGTLTSIRVYDPLTDQWSSLPNLTHYRRFARAYPIGDRVYLHAGNAPADSHLQIY